MTTPRKFRVWDGETMHEPPHRWIVGSNGNVYQLLEREDHGVYQVVHEDMPAGRLMYFTGLTDNGGTEIYEGDVVEFWEYDYPVELSHTGSSELGLVVYIDAHWWINFDHPGKMFLSDISYKDHTTKVIGNRYENPDLLNEQATQ